MGPDRPGAPRAHVLLIDDDPVVARVVERLLSRHGFAATWCVDGAAGAARLQEAPLPDVVLLDIELPEQSGIDICRNLRRDARFAHLPIMICSGSAKEQFIRLGLEAGANDYLEKPFTEAELVARVDNLARMARSSRELQETLEELQRRNETLAFELDAARQVQGALLPVSLAPHPSLRAAVFYEPMIGVGGDFYDLGCGPDGEVRLVVADVSGHGVFAALLAAFFKMGYQVYADREAGPAAVLAAIHREFCRAVDTGHFVTALAVWLDPVTGRLRYASAGHAPALLRRAAADRVERLLPTGPVLGILEGSSFGEQETAIEPGDGLLLMTDGILEALGPSGEAFGLTRVERIARRNPSGRPAELLQNLRIDLEEFQAGAPPEDDFTVLAVEWAPAAAAPGEAAGGAARAASR